MAWLASKEVSQTSAKKKIKTNKLSRDAFMGNRHIEYMLNKGGAHCNPQGNCPVILV